MVITEVCHFRQIMKKAEQIDRARKIQPKVDPKGDPIVAQN